MTDLQNVKNNLILKACKPAIFYTHTHTHTHLILKGKKIKNSNANLAFINNVNFRREILFRKFPSIFAFSKRDFAPFEIPTKCSALSNPAPRSVGQGIAILVALILVLHRALIARMWNIVVVVNPNICNINCKN